MGNCLVSVHVTGSHHNGSPSDIDQMAADFVHALVGKGYSVSAASIVTGADYNLLDASQRFPLVGVQAQTSTETTDPANPGNEPGNEPAQEPQPEPPAEAAAQDDDDNNIVDGVQQSPGSE
jgi:hypothetical protein